MIDFVVPCRFNFACSLFKKSFPLFKIIGQYGVVCSTSRNFDVLRSTIIRTVVRIVGMGRMSHIVPAADT